MYAYIGTRRIDGHVRASERTTKEYMYTYICNGIRAPSVACGRKSREIRGDFNGDCDFYPLSMRAPSVFARRGEQEKKVIRRTLEVLKIYYISDGGSTSGARERSRTSTLKRCGAFNSRDFARSP